MDLVEFVDEILESQDKNNDGYIDFPEFSGPARSQGPTGGGQVWISDGGGVGKAETLRFSRELTA